MSSLSDSGEFQNRKDTRKPLIPVSLWFRSSLGARYRQHGELRNRDTSLPGRLMRSTGGQTPAHRFRAEPHSRDASAVESLVRESGVFSEAEVAIARELVEDNLARSASASGYHFLFADGPD